MPLREVFPDRVAQRSIRTRTFHRRLDALHALFDGFAYELILRRKMFVEPAVGQSRRGHDLRKAGCLNAAFIEFAGGHLHDSRPCLGRLFSRLSHLSTPFFSSLDFPPLVRCYQTSNSDAAATLFWDHAAACVSEELGERYVDEPRPRISVGAGTYLPCRRPGVPVGYALCCLAARGLRSVSPICVSVASAFFSSSSVCSSREAASASPKCRAKAASDP